MVNALIKLFFTALQMESFMLVPSVISKEMNPLFTRVSAKELPSKQKTHSTGFKVKYSNFTTYVQIMKSLKSLVSSDNLWMRIVNF